MKTVWDCVCGETCCSLPAATGNVWCLFFQLESTGVVVVPQKSIHSKQGETRETCVFAFVFSSFGWSVQLGPIERVAARINRNPWLRLNWMTTG